MSRQNIYHAGWLTGFGAKGITQTRFITIEPPLNFDICQNTIEEREVIKWLILELGLDVCMPIQCNGDRRQNGRFMSRIWIRNPQQSSTNLAYKRHWISTCAYISTKTKKITKRVKKNTGKKNWNGQKRTDTEKRGQKQTESDRNRQKQTETDRHGQNWVKTKYNILQTSLTTN